MVQGKQPLPLSQIRARIIHGVTRAKGSLQPLLTEGRGGGGGGGGGGIIFPGLAVMHSLMQQGCQNCYLSLIFVMLGHVGHTMVLLLYQSIRDVCFFKMSL